MIRPHSQAAEATLPLSNSQVAERLEEIADLLDAEEANPYRAGAYRNAARTVRTLDRPIYEIVAGEGRDALTDLPGVGDSLARSLDRLSRTGKLPLLGQLRGTVATERKLATVAGIGPKTALRIYESLGIDSLAELQAAAYDGRLARVPGIGRKRLRGVRESLAGRFAPRPKGKSKTPPEEQEAAPVDELLSVDQEYREQAQADRLLRIAPRRFNPGGKAWLPILRTQRGDRRYTAFYSNTAKAHELGAVHDWVIIYRDVRSGAGQWTALTSQFGPLRGRRVIRGRETECADYYRRAASEKPV